MAWCKEMLCFNWVEDERIIKEITLLNQGSFWKGMEEAFMLYNYRKPTNKEDELEEAVCELESDF